MIAINLWGFCHSVELRSMSFETWGFILRTSLSKFFLRALAPSVSSTGEVTLLKTSEIINHEVLQDLKSLPVKSK